METTESKAISILSRYMYFKDISIGNSVMREAYAHVYHLVYIILLSFVIYVTTYVCSYKFHFLWFTFY